MVRLRFASLSLALFSALALAPACGDDSGGGNPDAAANTADAPPGTPDAGGSDAGIPPGYDLLISGDWSLPANTEDYFCVVKTIPQTMYIKSFMPKIPAGTHHTVLTIYNGNLPDGISHCDFATNGPRMIYGSGVGSPTFTFPDGVAVKLNAGDRILLNLHLYNATDGQLSGTSGTYVQTIDAAQVQNEAQMVLMGPTASLNVPVGGSTQSGSCSIQHNIHVFSVAPHMHKLGIHWKSVATKSGQQIVLEDRDYSFDNQIFYMHTSPTIDLAPNDKITTFCTYNNNTGHTVTFGESTNNEMCFSSTYYYPADGASFICGF
jgi:hypothetical protein